VARTKDLNYTTYRQRLQSFTNWPSGKTPSPQALSAAGFYDTGTLSPFFYLKSFLAITSLCNFHLTPTGKWDLTRCFHCGGALEHWDATDDAWREHSYWFPYCVHLTYVKGDTFIKENRRLRSQQLNGSDVVG
jgi:hypothetical protein